MSLIHWWPLDGTLYDYGTNPKHGTLVGSEANVTTPGILGKCLGGMNNTKTENGVNVANCNLVNELSQGSYSFACWFKVHGNHNDYNGTIMSSGDWNGKSWAVGLNQANTQIDMFSNGYNTYIDIGEPFINIEEGTGLTPNKWYHLVSVQKDGINTVYLNGILIGSASQIPICQSDATNLCIGRETYLNGYFSFNGNICDVRVYDHALSYPEVQELKRACIVHYNFENFLYGTNLVESNDFSNNEYYSYDDSGVSSVTNLPHNSFLGTIEYQSDGSVLIKDNKNTYNKGKPYEYQNTRVQYVKLLPAKKDDVFTISIKYKLDSGEQTFRWQIQELDGNNKDKTVHTFWTKYDGNLPDGMSIAPLKEVLLSDGWKLLSCTIKVTRSECTRLRFWLQDGADYTTYYHSYYLKDFRVFKATYEKYEKQYDCSGYNHHANVYGVKIKNDSITGNFSAYFDDTGRTLLTHKGAAYDTKNLSVALWFKSSSQEALNQYHIPLAIDDECVEISIPDKTTGSCCGFLRYGIRIDKRYVADQQCKDNNEKNFSLLDGNWHHIVITYNGNKLIPYVDGKKQSDGQSCPGTINFKGNKLLSIGKYYETVDSQYGCKDSYISDVRIYNTTLTENDIIELYNHTVKITDNKTMISNFFKEDKNTNVRIHESGMVSCNEIYNRLNNTKINGFRFKDNGNNSGNLEITDIIEI